MGIPYTHTAQHSGHTHIAGTLSLTFFMGGDGFVYFWQNHAMGITWLTQEREL